MSLLKRKKLIGFLTFCIGLGILFASWFYNRLGNVFAQLLIASEYFL